MATTNSGPATAVLRTSIGCEWRRVCVFKQLKRGTVKPLLVKRFRVSATTVVVEAKPVRVVIPLRDQLSSPSIRRGRVATMKRADIARAIEIRPGRLCQGLDLISNGKVVIRKNVLACPICYSPLTQNADPALAKESISGIDFDCSICKKLYTRNDIYLDLTIGSGAREYKEATPASSELFRTQLVSFLYERGWRQNFTWGGFPGPDKEFEMAKNYLKPVLGGNVVDASCGSGLFSRLFVKSGLFSQVFALDFSENMLRQCYKFVESEEGFPKEKLVLVRADISRLPFVSNSIDALHAGAALHCWPSPSSAVAEISRVLKPGGVFVATTFILDSIYPIFPLPLMLLKQYASRAGIGQVFLSGKELEDLCKTCGLVGYTCTRNGSFIMLSARKPS
ncbi:hypothetical protein Syun_013623 [Stephania yunnanensis]|uniref:Methyltransferase type 11 domain-containing protein n=1 Tax=Stephania yunnanensis TaxID=152371 RepID=A0AAP0JHR3_9MAGN